MLKSFKVKLDPTPTQERALHSHVGAARFAYNSGLAHVKNCLDNKETCGWSHYELRQWWNTHKDELAPWWAENSKETYSNALRNLSRALNNRFSTSRKKKAGFPKFKVKSSTGSYTITTGSFGVADTHGIKVPRIGRIHTLESLGSIDPDSVKSMTISRHGGYWYASLAVDVEPVVEPSRKRPRKERSVGVDVGISAAATLSTGEKIANPRLYSTAERKRRKLAKSVSRKVKGSRNFRKAKATLAKFDARTARHRENFLHQLTTDLVNKFDRIAIEDLNVSGMVKNHYLAKSILDVGFSEFRRQLEYKSVWNDVELVIVDRWFPSTKTCSNCAAVKPSMGLSERVYRCEFCGISMDRDINAAMNIDSWSNNSVAGSTPETLNACGVASKSGVSE